MRNVRQSGMVLLVEQKKTPRIAACPKCSTVHNVYPDFDTGPDAELCGSCWLRANADDLPAEAVEAGSEAAYEAWDMDMPAGITSRFVREAVEAAR